MTFTRNTRGGYSSRHQKSYFGKNRNLRGDRPQNRGRGGKMSFFNPTQIIGRNSNPEVTPEYKVQNTFLDFKIVEVLKNNVVLKGYKIPTPIQDQAIPAILSNRDVIGIANTGTGKTAAFLIPLLNKAILNSQERVLIVAPTRELAVQIEDEFYTLKKGTQVYSALCIGGQNIHRQKSDLRHNPQFVIGTPGRLKDLVKEGNLKLSTFSTVVLDEADHMVDIGFIHDVKFIISQLSTPRQSLFFSATIDGNVKEILQSFVHNPVTISVKTGETAENVEQDIVHISDRNKKIDILHDLLIRKEFEKVLIFGRTKWGVQKLADELTVRGFKVAAIHGNKNLNQRLRALEDFKRNYIQILLATDVASRGLDIDDVSHVINYELPASQDDYIHRIGRTGRADKKGIALTFVER